MLNIEAQEVLRQAREYNLIPVVKRILADMETPIRLFSRFAEQEYAFLLESVEGGSNWARYSFIGTDPFITISGKNGVITVEHDGRRQQMEGKPIEELKALLRQYRSPMVDGLPPFTGGAISFSDMTCCSITRSCRSMRLMIFRWMIFSLCSATRSLYLTM